MSSFGILKDPYKLSYSVIFLYAASCLLWLFHVLSQHNPCPPFKGGRRHQVVSPFISAMSSDISPSKAIHSPKSYVFAIHDGAYEIWSGLVCLGFGIQFPRTGPNGSILVNGVEFSIGSAPRKHHTNYDVGMSWAQDNRLEFGWSGCCEVLQYLQTTLPHWQQHDSNSSATLKGRSA